jgi:hypothetical protein
MKNLIDDIEQALSKPEWENWHFHSLKRRVDDHGVVTWGVYISYEDGGDPRGLNIVTRSDSLYGALRDMLLIVTNGDPADPAWY